VTFLVKVKAHRGEHANEEANIQADKAISEAISSKDVPWDKSSCFHMARASLERRYGEL